MHKVLINKLTFKVAQVSDHEIKLLDIAFFVIVRAGKQHLCCITSKPIVMSCTLIIMPPVQCSYVLANAKNFKNKQSICSIKLINK